MDNEKSYQYTTYIQLIKDFLIIQYKEFNSN